MLKPAIKTNNIDINFFSQLESINKNKESINKKIREYRKDMELICRDEKKTIQAAAAPSPSRCVRRPSTL